MNPPSPTRSIAWKLLPVLLALLGMWLMAGCFKIPVWEYRSFDEQHDFRAELGDAHSKRPVRPGAISRNEVVARFGKPSYVSKGRRSVEYLLETNRAVYVWPLCFKASPANQRLYTLTLDFDAEGQLSDWNLTHSDRTVNWFMDLQHMAVPFHDDGQPLP
jgi:hypothetical protein